MLKKKLSKAPAVVHFTVKKVPNMKKNTNFSWKQKFASFVVLVLVLQLVSAVSLIQTAQAAASISITKINGNPPTGQCMVSPITIEVAGKNGNNGGTYYVDIDWGDGQTTTNIPVGSRYNTFDFSKTHNMVGVSTSTSVFLHHSTASGNDSHATVSTICAAPVTTAVLTVKKHVINDNGGIATAANFNLHVKNSASVDVNDGGNGVFSPVAGSETGKDFIITPNGGVYTVSEDAAVGYTQTGSVGNCSVTLVAGNNYTCTITNDDNAPIPNNNLIVTKNGTGTGSVGNSPSGSSCGAGCFTYASGTPVTLTATADANSDFTGWSGACSGTAVTCNLTMSTAKSVTASFALKTFALNVTVTGLGTVTSGNATDINCGTTCNHTYTDGDAVTLTATPNSGDGFVGWSGACSGTAVTCNLTMDGIKTVGALFQAPQPNPVLNVLVTGSGSVSADSGTISNCTGSCSDNTLASGTVVNLSEIPATGFQFDGWSGACSGTGACSVTLDSDKTVAATFSPIIVTLTVHKDGTGSGTVTSTSGVNCGSTCGATSTYGTTVTLTESPDAGSTFAGWSVVPCGTSTTCDVILNSDLTVTATFSQNSTPPATPSTIFHFIKTVCPAYNDIAGNGDAQNLDVTGGNFTKFNNYSATTPNFPTPYASKPVTPAEIPAQCVKASGWQFKLSSDQAQTSDVLTTNPTGSNGEVDLAYSDLTPALQIAVTSPNQMWISEVAQNNLATFGALRCYNDATNGDNLEYMNFNSGSAPSDVYCIAYNVTTVTGGDGGDSGGSTATNFTLTVTKSGDGNGTVDGSVNGTTSTTFCGLDQCNSDKEQQAFVQTYASGTVVTLTSTPDGNSNFNGTWSGACTGTAPCTLTITGNLTANAHFGTNTPGGGGNNGCVSNCGGGGGSAAVIPIPSFNVGGGNGGNNGQVLGANTGPSAGGGSNPQGQVLGDSTLPRTGMPIGMTLLILAAITAMLDKKLKLI